MKASASKVLKSTLQRCRVHFIHNALAHASKGQRQAVLAMIHTILVCERPESASSCWPMAHRGRSTAAKVSGTGQHCQNEWSMPILNTRCDWPLAGAKPWITACAPAPDARWKAAAA